jgi:hypothetical protein
MLLPQPHPPSVPLDVAMCSHLGKSPCPTSVRQLREGRTQPPAAEDLPGAQTQNPVGRKGFGSRGEATLHSLQGPLESVGVPS